LNQESEGKTQDLKLSRVQGLGVYLCMRVTGNVFYTTWGVRCMLAGEKGRAPLKGVAG